ncbi:hypothetical protein, partial [Aeromonas sobria]|uniref:hypothetical protein n=1 Tax=Aeromonas sobria TaxID=646 RepID=UPI003F33638D
MKAEGLFFHFVYCMFIYLKKNIFWKALNFGENHEKRWRWLATFFKTLAVKELIIGTLPVISNFFVIDAASKTAYFILYSTRNAVGEASSMSKYI